jgi:hypothetical protein
MTDDLKSDDRAKKYADNRCLQLATKLGEGTDGSVWKTSNNYAIKAFHREKLYFRELECYQRSGVQICGILTTLQYQSSLDGLTTCE